MASNPLKTLSNALTGMDPATAEARAVQARQAVIGAGAAVEQAKVNLAAADDAGDAQAVLKAEASLISANRDADRATRALSLAEDKLTRAKQSAQDAALSDARKRLAGLITQRDKAGKDIEQALQTLEQGVKALAEIDDGICALPTNVLGHDCVPGHNLGKAAMDRQMAFELQQRGIQGRPSSVALPSFAQWLATGSELLRSRV